MADFNIGGASASRQLSRLHITGFEYTVHTIATGPVRLHKLRNLFDNSWQYRSCLAPKHLAYLCPVGFRGLYRSFLEESVLKRDESVPTDAMAIDPSYLQHCHPIWRRQSLDYGGLLNQIQPSLVLIV